MNPSIRRSLWTAFGALFVFVTIAAAINIIVLQGEKEQYSRVIKVYGPLMENMMAMDAAIASMLAAARGYTVTQQTQFIAQYEDAVRNFEQTAQAALELAERPRDRQLVGGMREHFRELKALCDRQIDYIDKGQGGLATDVMIDAARIRRSAFDFAGAFTEREKIERAAEASELEGFRLALTLLLIAVSIAILFVGAILVLRIERQLEASVTRQTRRTEAMIGGMADGVMLVDGEGKVAFINPAGVQMLGNSTVGIPIEKQPQVYGFRTAEGRLMEPEDLPAAQALSSGQPAKETTVNIDQGSRHRITVTMSAVPLHEDGVVTGVIVTIRDITERRRFEEDMKLQTERAQILADVGAFFSSNIDPVWVTQAIAERVAEALGDWSAVILKSPDSNELKVGSIYHRDMAALGLAWSFIYRQPLVLGEGLFGQVISTGYPSLTTNLDMGEGPSQSAAQTYHAVVMRISSLLVLPLRARRQILGALVIASHAPERAMTDDKLPVAELLAERAAVAIDNAQLYAEQVEARHKLEDLSRLKDEFLSIASHELRTPVTSIKGYTQLAKTLIRENDLHTSDEYLEIALDQIDRMSRLILELLDVSRIETGRLEIRREPIDWSGFVRSVVDRHQTAVADRVFRLELPSVSKEVFGDRDRLEQVLTNLLENSVKYSPEGSAISATIRDEGDRVITSISDQGIGIPNDELSLVFERFHRGRQVSATNYGGLGLGLYITKQIVERHGGTIWVESREGQGTTFYFSLPVQPLSKAATAAPSDRYEQPQPAQA
jgi:PAS domain S-box-containing protein